MTCDERIRAAAGRSPGPSAAIIDSQSVKGSEMIARSRRGYDAGKKINGTKRHVAVDALGQSGQGGTTGTQGSRHSRRGLGGFIFGPAG